MHEIPSQDAKSPVFIRRGEIPEILNEVDGLAVFESDEHGRIASWNEGARALFEYAASEIVGRPVSVLSSKAEDTFRSDHLGDAEGWRARRSGTRFWASEKHKRLRGRPGLLHVVRDISDQRSASLALQRQTERLRSVVDTLADAVITLNADGLIENWSKGAEKVFGYANHEVTGLHFQVILDAPLPPGADGTYWRVLSERGEIQARRKEGAIFPAEVSLSTFELSGKFFFTAILRDITERKRSEAALVKALEAAEAANRSKSRFLANISHEIRTPLTVISGYNSIVRRRVNRPEEVLKLSDTIQRHCNVLEKIINDILDLARAEAGKLSIRQETFDLREFFHDIEASARVLVSEKGQNLSVQTDLNRSVYVKSDPGRIRQILNNLLSNAIKFTPANGKIKIDVKTADHGDQLQLQVEVEDTGIGIPSEKSDQLFRAFAQISEQPASSLVGTGLGLAVSRRLAELLNGDLHLERSTPELGSVFQLNLQVEKPPLEERQSVELGPERKLSLAGWTILVVDDTEEIRYLVTELLEYFGASTISACGGEEALAEFKARGAEIDLVLLDIRMPRMDGFETRRNLKELGCKKPIIALTAHAMRDEIDQILGFGFDAYLPKPVDLGHLLGVLSSALERSEA